MGSANLLKGWFLLTAVINCMGAAWVKTAARRRHEQVGRLAGQGHQF